MGHHDIKTANCSTNNCRAHACALSMFDQYYAEVRNFPVYVRATKWKCTRGHINITTRLVDHNKRTIK